ncbi:MAG TPA: c-type cytochrome [Candidatus Binataceae bacterium]|jgi:mono/diheme cytochrome c family protein/nitrate reductase cytochrome c-type subunit
MATKFGLDQAEEGKSYSALFVLMIALLLVGAVWSIWDDNISRRPWKQYQVRFARVAFENYTQQAAELDKKLAQDPNYVHLTQQLAAAQKEIGSGATEAKLADLKSQLVAVKTIADDKDQAVRFTKSELTEYWYDYNHAIQVDQNPAPIKADIDRLNARLAKEQAISDQALAVQTGIQAQIDAINSRVQDLTEQLTKITKDRDDLLDKADSWMIPVKFGKHVLLRYPKIPKIEQDSIDDFDRNAFDQAIARVDRCQSCHVGEDMRGFENAPHPFSTHPNFNQIILKHPPDKFGCTPCHEGQGPALNSVIQAHGLDEFWEHPLLQGPKMESRCIKCHIDVGSLRTADGAQIAGHWVAGERLFEQLGCAGCHLVQSYEDLNKIGPYLKLAAAKLDPSWTVRWINNPHTFRPHTRMPNFMLSKEQATAVAAYLLDSSKDDSQKWLTDHAEPATLETDLKNPAMVEEGKGLFESIGCKGCHSSTPNEFGSPVGDAANFKPDETRTTKDFAPNLSKIAEKTDPRWIYFWLKNPRDFSPHTAMPSLRLNDHEAAALTAYLSTLGAKRVDPGIQQVLAQPDQIAKGKALIRKYGCFGCHEIQGMDHESRIGVELTTFGSKHLDELFFGDRTDVKNTWDDWTYHKLQSPRVYATGDVEQLMPQFDLQDPDIQNLRVFLAGLTEAKVPERYRMTGSHRQEEIVTGRRMVNFYNCVGCHIIENRGGYIRRFYQDNLNFAPPILDGEGAKVQPQWLFGFVQSPTTIRPWLRLRMPTFHVTNAEANNVVNYFASLADISVPFVFLNTNDMPQPKLLAGQKLMSKDYFNCFSCHQQGDKKPEGPPDGWAPDLTLARHRLNPEWIPVWLHNPQAVQPGTKMPSFYPGGPDDILGGNEDAQIHAIRDYIFWLGDHPSGDLSAPVAQAPATKISQK